MMKRIVISFILMAGSMGCARYLDVAVDSPSIEGDTAVFRYHSPAASTVQVSGDWNNWGRGEVESGEVLTGLMERKEGGSWELAVKLPPGRYRYRFVIDEAQTVLDPENPRVVNDRWGGKASLLIMP
ncbi:MAG TPA: glycogen-binding domain-containing protein [Candidatus Krumholzibacterium sp.]|nr:glycogen-binding domain-containing protein [Candidatus Krumholzibacterium sp.]